MLEFVAEALTIFRHKPLRKPQDQPYPHIKPNYDTEAQYSEATDESQPLSKERKKIS